MEGRGDAVQIPNVDKVSASPFIITKVCGLHVPWLQLLPRPNIRLFVHDAYPAVTEWDLVFVYAEVWVLAMHQLERSDGVVA